jgi:hypothetical protein
MKSGIRHRGLGKVEMGMVDELKYQREEKCANGYESHLVVIVGSLTQRHEEGDDL